MGWPNNVSFNLGHLWGWKRRYKELYPIADLIQDCSEQIDTCKYVMKNYWGNFFEYECHLDLPVADVGMDLGAEAIGVEL